MPLVKNTMANMTDTGGGSGKKTTTTAVKTPTDIPSATKATNSGTSGTSAAASAVAKAQADGQKRTEQVKQQQAAAEAAAKAQQAAAEATAKAQADGQKRTEQVKQQLANQADEVVPTGQTDQTPEPPTAGGGATGYNNGLLSSSQVAEMQRYYGTAADGMWGPNSTAAAGGLDANTAWAQYQQALQQQQSLQQQQTLPAATVPNTPTQPQVTAPALQEAPEAPDLQALLDQWLGVSQEQQERRIDYATQQGITELQRAQEDAQQEFAAARAQADLAGRKALDNQALYAEARGDRGGIGATQYALLQNQIAKNQLAIQQQQIKLSTDTARQISDLRAQGEFEKADAVLSLTQNYLSQLMTLKQWAANYAMDVVSFNNQIAEWQANYEMELAGITGYFQGELTRAAQDDMASMGLQLLKLGIMPSEQQLAAMGMSSAQAGQIIALNSVTPTYTGSPGGGPGATDRAETAEKVFSSYSFTPAQQVVVNELNAAYVNGDIDANTYREYVGDIKARVGSNDAANALTTLRKSLAGNSGSSSNSSNNKTFTSSGGRVSRGGGGSLTTAAK